MKKLILFSMIGLLSVTCNGQKDSFKNEKNKNKQANIEQPKGVWKVDKEFDENGNLIKYDSIYSWSSDGRYMDLNKLDKDSLLQSFKSRFYTNFSDFEDQGFNDIFSPDSLFAKQFFNNEFFESDFGKDLMDLDKSAQQMLEREKKFLEKYQSEFIKPKKEIK